MKSRIQNLNLQLFTSGLPGVIASVFGFFIAVNTNENIYYDTKSALFWAVTLLTFLNLFLRPILLVFAYPLVVISFGLMIWVINALIFRWVGAIIEGFHVTTWGAAFWGAFVMSLISFLFTLFWNSRINLSYNKNPSSNHHSRNKRKNNDNDDDVIDI